MNKTKFDNAIIFSESSILRNKDCFASVLWYYNIDNTITLTFFNHITGRSEQRNYKTLPAAKCGETRFINRMNRIYNI